MTAGFASRRLREVGGVSRNRLLVDKMIVWRTILGLIMASKWPGPESQICLPFFNDRRQALVIQRKQISAMRAPAPRIPRHEFINWAMWTSATCNYAADCRGFTRGVVAELNRKIGRSGEVFQVPTAGLKVQAGALPNPDLSFELDNALGSGSYKGLGLIAAA